MGQLHQSCVFTAPSVFQSLPECRSTNRVSPSPEEPHETKNLAFSTSQCTEGAGIGVVVRTGNKTLIGAALNSSSLLLPANPIRSAFALCCTCWLGASFLTLPPSCLPSVRSKRVLLNRSCGGPCIRHLQRADDTPKRGTADPRPVAVDPIGEFRSLAGE